jgi:hydroxyacylglutathione hydrolase
MPAETRLFKCLSDNYGVLLHDPDTGATTLVASRR